MKSGIRTVDDYYRTVVGSGSAAWLRYLAWQMPGIVAAFLALVKLNPWQTLGTRSLLSLGWVTLLSVGLALVFGMTIVVGVLVQFIALD